MKKSKRKLIKAFFEEEKDPLVALIDLMEERGYPLDVNLKCIRAMRQGKRLVKYVLV